MLWLHVHTYIYLLAHLYVALARLSGFCSKWFWEHLFFPPLFSHRISCQSGAIWMNEFNIHNASISRTTNALCTTHRFYA
ncbi:hypothetical protein DFP73DRAFT_83350 [Morchella snyderi]|nr:hypothetical protein DFP73DRAFT_83350 [Morchella snyderi]